MIRKEKDDFFSFDRGSKGTGGVPAWGIKLKDLNSHILRKEHGIVGPRRG